MSIESATPLLCKEEDSSHNANDLVADNEHGYCSRERFVNDEVFENYVDSSTRPQRHFLFIPSAASANVGTATRMTIDSGRILDAKSSRLYNEPTKLFTEPTSSNAIDPKKTRKPDRRKKSAKLCIHCGKHYLNLSPHIRAMHTGADASSAIVCAICEKTFQRVELLRSHNQRVHSEYKVYDIISDTLSITDET